MYDIADPDIAVEFVAQLGLDLQDESCPPAVRQLGRTIRRWHAPDRRLAPGPRVQRAHRGDQQLDQAHQANIGFGFREFAHYRIRVLLYAGRPNWDLLATVTPR